MVSVSVNSSSLSAERVGRGQEDIKVPPAIQGQIKCEGDAQLEEASPVLPSPFIALIRSLALS